MTIHELISLLERIEVALDDHDCLSGRDPETHPAQACMMDFEQLSCDVDRALMRLRNMDDVFDADMEYQTKY